MLLSIASPHSILRVWSHFIRGCSDIICCIHIVVVIPELPDGLFSFTICFLYVKVKQSCYRPGVAQRVPES